MTLLRSKVFSAPSVVYHFLVFGVLFGYVIFPFLTVLFESFRTSDSPFTFSNYAHFFSLSGGFRALINSLLLSVLTVLFSGMIGTTISLLLTRYNFQFNEFLASFFILPIAMPPLVGALAFQLLLSDFGLYASMLAFLLGQPEGSISLEGFPAVLLIHIFAFTPHFLIFVKPALNKIDSSVLEASELCGASPSQTFQKVLLPLIRPSLLTASILVFTLSMASFTGPLLFSGKTPFLTVELFNQKTLGNYGQASAMTLILLLISVPLVGLYHLSEKYAQGSKTFRESQLKMAPVWAWGIVSTGLIFFFLPLLSLLFLAFGEGIMTSTSFFPESFSFHALINLFNTPSIWESFSNSFRLGLLASVPNLFFGLIAGYAISRKKIVLPTFVDSVISIPLSIPATALGIAVLAAFSSNGIFSNLITFNGFLLGTSLLPLAYFIRHLPFITRSVSSALDVFNYSLVEAGTTLGVGYLKVITKIMLPIIIGSVISGFMFTLISAIIEFPCSILLYTPDNIPVSVQIFSLMRDGSFQEAGALGVILLLFVFSLTWVSGKLFVSFDSKKSGTFQ
ncbi:MAG: iron ABC transporter permease [Chloroherpetonaceae bacterium]|nr:iron ABC transporter permease [Chloroherpetonaceae bacterium]